MKILRLICRVLVGAVFMFSGFIKAVDPLGSTYKFKEYFEALGMEWLAPYAFAFSVIMIGAEFIIGFCLFFGFKLRLSTWGALLLMLFFLPLTLWLAISNKVSDCGCFGDAIKLSNWQTFYKNVIIMIPVLVLFIQQKRFKPYLSCDKQWLFAGVGALIISGIMWYSYAHLPLIDFLPYKVGTNLVEKMKVPDNMPKDVYEQFITVKDTTLNKTIEITVDTYSNDSTYWGTGTKYKYVSISEPKLVKKGYETPIHDFSINKPDGTNILDSVLEIDNYTFILVLKKVEEANISNIEQINILANWAKSKNLLFLGLTSSLEQEINSFINSSKTTFEYYTCDETTLKTMIRANPGVIVLKKGIIVAKWHSNDIPSPEDFEKEFLTK
ncbi:MAG: DoxX family protein [Bacteroidia bacterium]|nr:DoxX family protein [Bacteroidia bacterium]